MYVKQESTTHLEMVYSTYIFMVMTGGWFMTLFYPHESICEYGGFRFVMGVPHLSYGIIQSSWMTTTTSIEITEVTTGDSP